MCFIQFLLPPDTAFRCLDDVDDEVRDRAAMYLRVIDDAFLVETYVKEGNVKRLHTIGLC